jgi:hypothetical protein
MAAVIPDISSRQPSWTPSRSMRKESGGNPYKNINVKRRVLEEVADLFAQPDTGGNSGHPLHNTSVRQHREGGRRVHIICVVWTASAVVVIGDIICGSKSWRY